MLVKEAKLITGGLGFTAKTGMSYGLPAVVACNVGSKLATVKGSVCYGCYACQGRYRTPTVIACQSARLESVRRLTDDTLFTNLWIEAMVLLITRKNARLSDENKDYFRWHDSGDLISMEQLSAIAKVAKKLPKINFWVPTKEIRLVNFWLMENIIPKNLCIRISGTMVDQKAPDIRLPVSNVHTKKPLGKVCPAIEVHSGCGRLGCRKCWDKKVKAVSYRRHI